MSTVAATDSLPLRRAYRDILLFAGWVREGKLASSRYTELRAWVDRTLRAERSQLLRAGLDEELVADAQLIAIALVDEAVQAGPARDLAEQWGRDTLQYAQYKHNNLGRDFFDRLDYWQRRPDVPLGLLELFARVLSWGFEGRYREENRLGDLRTLRESLQNDLIRRTGSLPPLAPPLSALAKLPLPPPIVRAPWVFGMGTSLLLALGLVLTLLLHMHAGRVSHELSTAPAGGSEGESGAAPR
jgi:type VI secretion system protein ImpK